MLKNVTTWLLSDTVQGSMASVGLTPTSQNATVSSSVTPVSFLWPCRMTSAACQIL